MVDKKNLLGEKRKSKINGLNASDTCRKKIAEISPELTSNTPFNHEYLNPAWGP